MDERIRNLVDECKRQENSCLYTSTTFFEWLKSLRRWRIAYIITPIILGAVATWPLLIKQTGYEWITGTCALLAGILPAVYKALDLDTSLEIVRKQAHEFKILQDRFRQAWRIHSLGNTDDLTNDFDNLMARMDAARALSITAPERFFKKAQKKIQAGDYEFPVDR
jgi:hypothetical protein